MITTAICMVLLVACGGGDADNADTVGESADIDYASLTKSLSISVQGDAASALAFSPDSTSLATCGNEDSRTGTTQVWDIETGEEVVTKSGPRRIMWKLAYRPDGEVFAGSASDGWVYFFNPKTNKESSGFGPDLDPNARTFDYSPDGRFLAIGREDSEVRLLDGKSLKELRTCNGHTEWILSVAFSKDGNMLVSGGKDKTVRVWNTTDASQLHLFEGHEAVVVSVAINADSNTVASADLNGVVKVWSLAPKRELYTIAGDGTPCVQIAFSLDGSALATSAGKSKQPRPGYDSPRITLWDAKTGEMIKLLDGVGPLFAISPDGKSLAAGGHNSKVSIWSANTRD